MGYLVIIFPIAGIVIGGLLFVNYIVPAIRVAVGA